MHDKLAFFIDGKLYASDGGLVKGDIDLSFRPSAFVPNVAQDALIGNGQRPLGPQEQVVGTLVGGAEVAKGQADPHWFFDCHVGVVGEELMPFGWEFGGSAAHGEMVVDCGMVLYVCDVVRTV